MSQPTPSIPGIFASQHRVTIEIGDTSVEIRKLSHSALSQARAAQQAEILAAVSSLPEAMQEEQLREAREQRERDQAVAIVEEALAKPTNDDDAADDERVPTRIAERDEWRLYWHRPTVLVRGIVSVDRRAIGKGEVDDLEQHAAELLFDAIMELTQPLTARAVKASAP